MDQLAVELRNRHPYRCDEYVLYHSTEPSALTYSYAIVFTIPVLGLWNVQISLKNKLALLGIFSLTVIIVIFAIVRVAVEPNMNSSADITWLCLWAHVETGVGMLQIIPAISIHLCLCIIWLTDISPLVAVMVSCLASFRQLFVKSEQSSNSKQSSGSKSSWFDSVSSNVPSSRIRNLFSHKRQTQLSDPSTNSSSGRRSLLPTSQVRPQTAESIPSFHSTEHSTSMAQIHVDHKFGISSVVYPIETERPPPQVYTTANPANPRQGV